MACAYATLLAYGLMMFISVALGRKHYPVPYDFKRIVLYLVGGTLISFLSYYQFDRDILIGTVFLCVFVFIVVLLEKNDLKNLLKK
jgi:cell division protein FtsW (lipid II flippase)